jgi:septum formation protein
MEAPPIILASASPRRVELLRELRVSFTVVPAEVEELHDVNLSAMELCRINAERKAEQIAGRNPNAIVLGADTLVSLNGKIYGKPASLEEAKAMLRQLSGHTHQVHTAVCLVHLASGRRSHFVDRTEVRFRSVSEEEIAEYTSTVPVLDKAGAYGIQERGDLLVEGIAGSFSNVVGLPVERLAAEFDGWKVRYNWRKR